MTMRIRQQQGSGSHEMEAIFAELVQVCIEFGHWAFQGPLPEELPRRVMVRHHSGIREFKHVERTRRAASKTAQPANVDGSIVVSPGAAEINQQRIVNAAMPTLSEHPFAQDQRGFAGRQAIKPAFRAAILA